MQNQINSSIENNEVFFQCYSNILSNDYWEILEYSVSVENLNDLELKVLTKVIEKKLNDGTNRTD